MLSVIGMIESENWMWAKNYNDDEHCSYSSARGTWRNETDVLDPYMHGPKCTYNRGTWDDSEPEWEMKVRERKEAAVKREEKRLLKRKVVAAMNRREEKRQVKRRRVIEEREMRREERRIKSEKEIEEAFPKRNAARMGREVCWLFQTKKEKVAYICNEVITRGLATQDQRDNFFNRFHALPREKQKEIRQQLVMLYYKENLCKKYLKT